jgi:hypothetical protein
MYIQSTHLVDHNYVTCEVQTLDPKDGYSGMHSI